MRQAINWNLKKSLASSLLRAAVCSVLLASSAVAVADGAVPVTLSDQQMDRVSAGLQQSYSSAFAYALSGFATTTSQTNAFGSGLFKWTDSTSTAIAVGIGAGALASAGTIFR